MLWRDGDSLILELNNNSVSSGPQMPTATAALGDFFQVFLLLSENCYAELLRFHLCF